MAQPPRHFRHFTERDGLSDNRVQAIAQDSSGIIWIGTTNGLNRYDGIRFETFMPDAQHPETSIHHPGIQDLKVDRAGRLWIATYNGLECRDPRTGLFRRWINQGRNDGSLPNSAVLSLLIDGQDRLWVVCDNRDLCRYDAEQDRFVTYPWREFVLGQYPGTAPDAYLTIYYLKARSPESLWLHTNRGLYGFDCRSGRFDHVPIPSQLRVADSPSACGEAAFVASWDQDLLRFDPCDQTWARLPLPSTKGARTGEHVSDVHRYGNVWLVFTRFGLNWVSDNGTEVLPVLPIEDAAPTQPQGLVTEGLTDREGGLWIGGEQGLWLAEPIQQQFQYHPLRIPQIVDNYNCYTRFLELADGKMLALNYYYQMLQRIDGQGSKEVFLPGRPGLLEYVEGISKSGVQFPEDKCIIRKPQSPTPTVEQEPKAIRHSSSYQSENLPNGKPNNVEPAANPIWLGVGGKLFQCDHKSLTTNEFPIHAPGWVAPAKGHFEDIAYDWLGRAWIGHSEGGLLVYDPQARTWWHPDTTTGFISHAVSSIEVDHARQTVWIATQDYGLFRYTSDGRFRLYQPDPAHPQTSLAAYVLLDLHLDKEGRLWIACDPGGVSVMLHNAPEGQQFRNFGVAEGLPSGRVTGLCADLKDRIWVTTLGGLACIDFSHNTITAYNEEDGLPRELLDLPPYRLSDGSIIVGLKYGYLRFQPDSLLQFRPEPGILLHELQVLDSTFSGALPWPDGKGLNLDWRQDFLRFGWSGADVLDARRTHFQHRLRGFDADWIDSGPHAEAQYTRVPPGSYTFEVRSGQAGDWNPPGLRLSILIRPPYWDTWWFQVLVALVVIGLLLAFYLLRMRQVRREEAIKADFNERLARTEMTALRAQMNPHFVFNCLSSINRFILVNQPDEASVYLTKFSRLIRLILDNSRAESVLLSKELDALRLYVEMEQMRFSDGFAFVLDIAPEVQPEHLEIPPLLIQPYVENAIWHGLMHKSSPGTLIVRLRQAARTLVVEVEDNGIGRAEAQALKSRSATTQKSHGMAVTSERISLINKLYGTQAQVETIDLTDPTGKPSGTRVKLTLEVSR